MKLFRSILVILLLVFPLLAGTEIAAADSKPLASTAQTGFTVHSSDIEVVNQLFQLFREYRVAGSNWKFRDTNSLFVRIAGDESTGSDELFPGYSTRELDRLTREKGIVYWRQYPSLVWVSVKDMDTLKRAWSEDDRFKTMVHRLAQNPYRENSWFNLHGKSQNLDYSSYNKSLQAYQSTRRSGTEVPGIYNPQGIDYSNPALYLEPGSQSEISDENAEFIQRELGDVPLTLQGALKVQAWFNRQFTSGGMDVLRLTVNEYLQQKQFSGCTEAALILASVLRELGFPTVYIVTVDLPTARRSELGRGINSGHQMVEVFVQDRWVLLDDWGGYATDYDPLNPYIIRSNGNDRDHGFVIAKGRDAWECGLYGDDYYTDMCDNFIRSLKAGELDHYVKNPAIYQMKQYR